MIKSKIKLVMADDHPMFCESLTHCLMQDPDIEVVATCHNTTHCYETVLNHEPDIVLIDIEMPEGNAFDIIRDAAARQLQTRFIILSAYLSNNFLRNAIDAAASGYIVKTSNIQIILEAIRKVVAGEPFFCPEVSENFPNGLPSKEQNSVTRLELITPREQEVLRYVAKGYSVKKIAAIMQLSSRTVDRHKANIMEKLNIHNQVGLCRFAIAEGLSDIRSTMLATSQAVMRDEEHIKSFAE